MVEFAYRNNKSTNTSYGIFKPNFVYYSGVLFKEDIKCCQELKIVNNFLTQLQKLISICQENFYHV